jgi:hypothetical protein
VKHLIDEGVIVGLKEVWGFDPDEAARAQALFRGVADQDHSFYCIDDERAARIPRDAESQIFELRRIFRL